MLGPPLGWARMTRRLLWSTPWKPAHTLLAGAVSEPDTLDFVVLHNLPGIAGVTPEGHPWHLGTVSSGALSKDPGLERRPQTPCHESRAILDTDLTDHRAPTSTTYRRAPRPGDH
jgi:hypothetical protein